MKFYYYCMKQHSSRTIVVLTNLCSEKQNHPELIKLKEEDVGLFRLTECNVSDNICDVVWDGQRFAALHRDGTVTDINGNSVDTIPLAECAEHRSVTGCSLYRGKDGILYDGNGKKQAENVLVIPNYRGSAHPIGYVKKEGGLLQLFNPNGMPYKIPLARLKELDPQYFDNSGTVGHWVNKTYNYGWADDLVEVKSNKILFGYDGTCLFFWNDLPYTVVPNDIMYQKQPRSQYNIFMDAAYREEYEKVIDDIVQLVADKIYLNRSCKLVFMQGWNDHADNGSEKYDDAVVKAKKWENVVQCEILGKHLVGKTKDGRILSSFAPDICGGLRNIYHAFVSQDYAFFIVK